MAKKGKLERQDGPSQEPLTPAAAETLYKRVDPFLTDLYKHCLGLSVNRTLTEAQLNELAVKYNLTDLTLTPQTLLPLISTEITPIVDAANSIGPAMAELVSKTGLSPGEISRAPWPMVLTQWHLLSLSGSPPNERFKKLYSQQPQPLH